MKRLYIPLFCFLILVLESVLSYYLIDLNFIPENWILVSHWLLLFLIQVAIFYDLERTYYSLLYAIIFGLFVDLLHTDLIGVYLFVYTSVTYITHGIRKLLHSNFFVALLLSIIGIALAEVFIYFLYDMIQIHQVKWEDYWKFRLLPTIGWNLLFFLLIYLLFKKKLTKWSNDRFDRKD